MATAAASTARDTIKEFTFTWEGKDKGGKVVRGEMRAGARPWSTPRCAARASWSPRSRSSASGSGGKVTEKDITLFTRQLATMMKAGVPLLQSFDIVGKGAHQSGGRASC